jgi:hypothetical protein
MFGQAGMSGMIVMVELVNVFQSRELAIVTMDQEWVSFFKSL